LIVGSVFPQIASLPRQVPLPSAAIGRTYLCGFETAKNEFGLERHQALDLDAKLCKISNRGLQEGNRTPLVLIDQNSSLAPVSGSPLRADSSALSLLGAFRMARRAAVQDRDTARRRTVSTALCFNDGRGVTPLHKVF
jgi:hypothetical protein